ncbi:uncharacterized protein K452DRAFT_283098 [Neofusicoccum parvum]|nr:uncharacterized protein K452DRAFT_283098 [Neofusicoccum parvum]
MEVKEKQARMRHTARAFTTALLAAPPPSTLLSRFFTPTNPSIHEHGPAWSTAALPFLGRPFVGAAACESYFTLLSASLKMALDERSFPGEEGFVVDGEAATVAVRGRGAFESVATGRRWREEFVYVLGGWDGRGERFASWDVWADPLCAWVAVQEGEVEGWPRGEFAREGAGCRVGAEGKV